MDLSIEIFQKNGEYVANCPELDVQCFGPTMEKARDRLKSVIEFYIESAHEPRADTCAYTSSPLAAGSEQRFH